MTSFLPWPAGRPRVIPGWADAAKAPSAGESVARRAARSRPVPVPARASTSARKAARLAAFILATLAWIYFAHPAEAQEPPVDPCPGNLLVGGDMERGFSNRLLGDDLVANGWLSWFEAAPGNVSPRFAPADRRRSGSAAVVSGLRSQEVGAGAPVQAGGLWQRVDAPPESEVSASAWVWSLASAAPEGALVSDHPGSYAVSLGLDPGGGEDPLSEAIRWTAPVTITDNWLPLSLQVTVTNEAVTVFLKGQPLGDLPGSFSRWDDVCLRVNTAIEEPVATATFPPRPTATPRPDAPTQTPSLPTLEAMATELVADATATVDAAVAATAEASARAALRATAEAVNQQAAAEAIEATRPAAIPWWAWLADRLGIVAVGLALVALGTIIGFERPSPARPSFADRDLVIRRPPAEVPLPADAGSDQPEDDGEP